MVITVDILTFVRGILAANNILPPWLLICIDFSVSSAPNLVLNLIKFNMIKQRHFLSENNANAMKQDGKTLLFIQLKEKISLRRQSISSDIIYDDEENENNSKIDYSSWLKLSVTSYLLQNDLPFSKVDSLIPFIQSLILNFS